MGPRRLTGKILAILEKTPGQTVKNLAGMLHVNRTFLSGYLEAIENQGLLTSRKIGPARVYFPATRKVKRRTVA